MLGCGVTFLGAIFILSSDSCKSVPGFLNLLFACFLNAFYLLGKVSNKLIKVLHAQRHSENIQVGIAPE
jgi:hypothetical protein